MKIDKLSESYLFQQHSKQTVKLWIKQLKYFHFKRAWGGHANDGDEFQVAFSFTDREDLINKIEQIGFSLNIIPPDFPRAIIGHSYTGTEFTKFKSEIKEFPDLEQPGHKNIFGCNTFIWVYESFIKIKVAGTKDGNLYEVSEEDFGICKILESYFDKLNWSNFLDKSLEDNACCISQKRYPELYNDVYITNPKPTWLHIIQQFFVI
ncbi:hypothetical protein [Emticicia sp. SJ17W-69]|uniref:hypothetical protein n=1 Tax=Emticicia sp. SJ17W-69 TaxID=3421657 RepID=UPI003EC0B4DF